MWLKRADCSFLVLPLELCSGRCKSSFLLLLSSSKMSLLTYTVYTLQSVPRSQIQAFIQTSGLAKFLGFIAHNPHSLLLFWHISSERVWCKRVIETYPRVLNTPSVEPLEGLAHGRTCLPISHLSLSLPLLCPRLNSGRHVFPMGGDWLYLAPSCLLLAEARRWCSSSVSL